jgi:hypothetical protein
MTLLLFFLACRSPLSAIDTSDTSDTATDTTCDGYGLEDCDGDGYFIEVGVWSEGEDCDDQDPDTSPAAEEICDGLDNDCDGNIDEEWDVDVDPCIL